MSSFTWDSTVDEVATALSDHIKGKNVIITGCSPESIAFQVAKAVAARDPGVLVLTARKPALLEESKAQILAQSPNVSIKLVDFDLASQDSIRDAAERLKALNVKFDALINSAGVMATPYSFTSEGIEMQFGINHIGHFLLTTLLMPTLNDGASIVNVSSSGYELAPPDWDDINFEKRRYDKWHSYAQSKTANILFSAALARKLAARGIISFSVHPGTMPSQIIRHMTKEDYDLFANTPLRLKTREQGAPNLMIGAFDPSIRDQNGGYIDDDNHVKPIPEEYAYAVGMDNEDRLWSISEDLVNQKFQY
ncbi:NAD(P)-binding protein [Aspergillus californicus]